MAEVEILNADDDAEDVLEVGEEPAVAVVEEGNEPLDDEDFPDTLDDPDEVKNPHLVAQLREANERKTAQIRALEQQLARPVITRTKKPDLWDDCEGDPDKFETALLSWKDNEAAADEAERAPATKQHEQAQAWQTELKAYKDNGAKLGEGFQASEDAVVAALSDAQQSTIVMAAKNPARFINALGKSPNRLAQLSLITNPIKLAAEVARIEGGRTVARKEPANIDTPLRGSARLSTQSGDAKEDALIAKVANGGDATELRNYRREKRAKAA